MKDLPLRIVLKTPAKINLLLKILGKRTDGYHDIFTIMQMVDLWDEIIVEKSEDLKLVCSDPEIPSGKDNLIIRAAAKLGEISNTRRGASIRLHKVIPVAAGLGGGSSDAAAALFGLNLLWETGFTINELSDIGKELGSDIPFFFHGPAAIGYGRGDDVISLAKPPACWYVLVNPGVHISTAWAYGQVSFPPIKSSLAVGRTNWIGPFEQAKFELTKDEGRIKMPLPNGIRIEDSGIWLLPFNDLEEVVIKRYPEIGRIKEKMFACGAICSQMSGSGSTVFGVFSDRSSAERAHNKLQMTGCRSWVVRALQSSPYSDNNHQT